MGHPNFGNNIDVNKTLILRKKKRPSSKTKELVLNHKLKPYKCEICGITEWLGNPITLQLHHINGNPLDDRLENLQILCPHKQILIVKDKKYENLLNLSIVILMKDWALR